MCKCLSLHAQSISRGSRFGTIIPVVSLVVHDEFVIDEVEAVRFGLKWIVNQFLHCIETRASSTILYE